MQSGAVARRIHITGTVQGVGFRPFVWHHAQSLTITGAVWNDAAGVVIEAYGSSESLDKLEQRLRAESPPLARVESVSSESLPDSLAPATFHIVDSHAGLTQTAVAADAATCPDCLREILNPSNRRYRYPFTNCTHCGPRLSIIRAVPYDRANTSMAKFAMCPACEAEYHDPADRRFHAQPNACPVCGPMLWWEDADGNRPEMGDHADVVEQAAALIKLGSIVAIKGIGGIHLACDAGDESAVSRLRQCKQRYQKSFALMAKNAAMAARYACIDSKERQLLENKAAPIVVLRAAGESLAESIAPGLDTLGFMLPYSPLHHLLFLHLDRPIVLTSGNRSSEPQCIDNDDARERLRGIADYWLLHDRDIVNRLDDSVVTVMDSTKRTLRRARGYAPQPLVLPPGFESAPAVLAMGAELKNTFCLLHDGRAVLSQHMGDLEDALTLDDARHNLDLYCRLFDFAPERTAVDLHNGYFSTRHGRQLALDKNLPLIEVQHHHAHVAACLAEHGFSADTPKVLGITLDGLGMGDNGTLWGGEFLLADYREYYRVGHFQPVPMPGGTQAILEPWRNTYAYLSHLFDWPTISRDYAKLELITDLQKRPLQALDGMMQSSLNTPLSSSCGRLFDAVAGALGICRDRVSHEGQAAMELEALAAPVFDEESGSAYAGEWSENEGTQILGWKPLWQSLLHDLASGVSKATIAARFHQSLCKIIAEAASRLCEIYRTDTVILGGGVFQNRLILEGLSTRLRDAGLRVYSPQSVPTNDGGIALGQACIAATRDMDR